MRLHRHTLTAKDVADRLAVYEERHGCTFKEYVASLKDDLGVVCETEDFRAWDTLVAMSRITGPPRSCP